MGNKKSKPNQTKPSVTHTEWPGAPSKSPQLNEVDYQFLVQQTGMPKADLKNIFDKFMANNPDGKLDRKEFVAFYSKLRPESPEDLNEISEFIFRAFDNDKNGFVSFNEFMIGFSLTSKGDLNRKLEYAFDLYDADRNGYLDKNEVREVVTGMLDLLGADKKGQNSTQLAEECIRQLDTSKDGKVTKAEFIDGLLKNYSLRALMSPFN